MGIAHEMAENRRPIRIAHIMGKMLSGGVEAVVMNYYRYIDKSKVQFDFIIDVDSTIVPQEEIEALGGRVFRIAPYQTPIRYHRDLLRLFRENKYRIVHSHINTMNVFPLFAAWCAGVPTRICHNHSAAHKGEGVKAWLKYLLRPFATVFATEYFACGEKSGRWMYGDKLFNAGRVAVINNAIDLKRFAFDCEARERIREALGLIDKLVIGHVGRFSYAKNHSFLIDIFFEISKRNPESTLLLIGDGPLREQIERKVKACGLEGRAFFLGVTSKPEDYYSAMDVFVLPSFFEGFPVVSLETQAAGLPLLMSDKVSKEVKATRRVEVISLECSAEEWAEKALGMESGKRESQLSEMAMQGYDIGMEAELLLQRYEGFMTTI